jgi:4-amino-4-deoxy-L-arabinose transferase-like glycosyltransferase
VTTSNREAERHPSFDLAVLLIVLLAIAFRLYRIDVPFVDAHSWRQVTNADITRHFAEGSMNPLVPRVSWGGLNGVVGMEFPLLHYLTAVVWLVTGEHEIVARLVAVAFSVGAVIAIYFLGVRLLGRPAGRAAAFLLAVSPSAVYFGRSFLSDTPMLVLSIAAVLAWDRYFDRPTVGRVALAALMTALAGLVKLPAILVLGGIGGLALSRLGWAAFRDTRLWAGIMAAIAMIAAWYWYADWIFLQSGLTQAVFRPSGTYPASDVGDVYFQSISHWATAERLLNPAFWWDMTKRFWELHLTPLGFLGAIAGIVAMRRSPRWLPIGLWTLAGFTLVVVAAEGQWAHEFHQLPVLPPLALLFGAAAAPLFDAAVLRRHAPRRLASIGMGFALSLIAVAAFRWSSVIPDLYRPDVPTEHFIGHGSIVQAVTPPDALMITVDYESGGANSPMLLYYARRQGWSFDKVSISPRVVERLRTTREAKYFVSSIGRGPLLQGQDDLRVYLDGFEVVPKPDEMDKLLIVDLTKPRTR